MSVTKRYEVDCDACGGIIIDAAGDKEAVVILAKARGAIVTSSGRAFCDQGCRDGYENR